MKNSTRMRASGDLPFIIFAGAVIGFVGWLWVQAIVMLHDRVSDEIANVVAIR